MKDGFIKKWEKIKEEGKKKKKENISNKGSKRFINDMIEENKEEITKKAKEFRAKKRKEEPENPFTKELDRLESKKEFENLQNVLRFLFAKKEKREATEEIVNYIKKNEHIYTTRDDERSEVWIYKEGIYIPQGKTFIRELCRNILTELYTTTLCNEVIYKIEADTYVDAEEFFSVKYINEIVVENGILNVKTKKLKSFTHKKIFFNKVPIIYDPKIKCNAITKHFKTILENKEDVPVMFELFGYLLYKEYKIEKAFIFSGSGRNGKSKTIELMKRFIGNDNVISISLQDLESDPYCISELMNKMANLAGDISSKTLKDTSCFKGLTGRDYISANRKFKTRVNFVNFAKMIFSANELPKTYDKTPAFWNRWLIINFPYTFLSKKEYSCRLEDELKMCKIADESIVEKITTKEEMSGLLNEAVKALNKLLKKGDFSYSKTTSEVKEMWIRKSDSLAAFLMDYIEEDYESKVTKQDFKRAYSLYCKHFKVKILGDKYIKNLLTTEFVVEDSRDQSSGNQTPIWKGIKFKISRGSIESNGFSTLGKKINFSLVKKTSTSITSYTSGQCKECGEETKYLTVEGLCPMCMEVIKK